VAAVIPCVAGILSSGVALSSAAQGASSAAVRTVLGIDGSFSDSSLCCRGRSAGAGRCNGCIDGDCCGDVSLGKGELDDAVLGREAAEGVGNGDGAVRVQRATAEGLVVTAGDDVVIGVSGDRGSVTEGVLLIVDESLTGLRKDDVRASRRCGTGGKRSSRVGVAGLT